jgi:hypothetical protein
MGPPPRRCRPSATHFWYSTRRMPADASLPRDRAPGGACGCGEQYRWGPFSGIRDLPWIWAWPLETKEGDVLAADSLASMVCAFYALAAGRVKAAGFCTPCEQKPEAILLWNGPSASPPLTERRSGSEKEVTVTDVHGHAPVRPAGGGRVPRSQPEIPGQGHLGCPGGVSNGLACGLRFLTGMQGRGIRRPGGRPRPLRGPS